jgi:hypothetical protein
MTASTTMAVLSRLLIPIRLLRAPAKALLLLPFRTLREVPAAAVLPALLLFMAAAFLPAGFMSARLPAADVFFAMVFRVREDSGLPADLRTGLFFLPASLLWAAPKPAAGD